MIISKSIVDKIAQDPRGYFTSRSRLEQFQQCHRKRYLGSDYEGVGLESVKLKLQAEVGSAVHKGVEVMLKIGQLGLAFNDPQLMLVCDLCNGQPIPESQGGNVCSGCKGQCLPNTVLLTLPPETIDIAVAAALHQFEQAFINHEVDATANESMQFIHDEHAALIEGLLRLWVVHPDGLPWLVNEYEVLEVEKWDLKELVAGKRCHCTDEIVGGPTPNPECKRCGGDGQIGGITLRSRSDALLRKRSDGGLYVWSLKTANTWDKRSNERGKHDVQGISEVVCIEERLQREHRERALAAEQMGVFCTPLERIDGVQMSHFIKGKRELDEGLNVYRIKTALLHPWAIESGFLGGYDYAHTYWLKCDAPHETGKRKKGGEPYMCEGGKNHNIGSTWKQVNIWEHMSMKEWVAKLMSGEIQPSMPLPAFFVNPMPYYRNDNEIKSWVRQVTSQERKVVAALQRLEQTSGEEREIALDEDWPMYRKSCDFDYGGKCQFIDVCYGPSAIADDPVGSGLYKLRERVEHEEAVNES